MIYYDITKTLSHNCLFNFIVGNRGSGKTYGFKEWAIKSYLRTRKQFFYVRRYKDELSDIEKYFDDIKEKFPEHDFDVKKGCFFIDSEVAGYYRPLSTAKIKKSVAFPLVDKICFDEFILDKGVYHYLPDEVTNFLDLYMTIARMRDVRMFFLSNAITITNPYFIYFDIGLPYGSLIYKRDEILLELVQNPEFIAEMEKTRFSTVIKGTDYHKYAIENQFLRDNDNFVEKKGKSAEAYFNFVYNDSLYGVWIDYKVGKMYVSQDIDPYCNTTYALTNDDHQPNTMFIKARRKSSYWEMFVDQYLLGNVRFESVHIKNICNQVIKWTL